MSKPPSGRPLQLPAGFAELESFSRQLNGSLQLDTVCQVLADGVQALFGAERCAIFLRDSRTEVVRCVLARGLSSDYIATIEGEYRQLPGGQLLEQRFLVIEDARSDERMASVRALVERNGFVSMLLVALRHQDVSLGAVAAYFDAPQRFDGPLLSLAQTLSNQAAIALANAQSYQLAQQRVAELEKLRQAAVEINGQPDLQASLDAITRRAADLLNAEGAYVYLHDAEHNELVVRSARNAPKTHLGRRIKVGEGLAGRVFQSRQPQLVGDYRSWKLASRVWEDVTFGTVMAVPLLYGDDDPVGVLTFVDNAKNRMWEEDAIRVASLFAYQAAAALTSALLLAESHRRADRLLALQRVTASVTAALDLRAVLQLVVEDLRRTFGYALTSIHRLEGDVLVLETMAGQPLEGTPQLDIKGLSGIVGRAALTAQSQHVFDVAADPDYVPVLTATRAEAAIPIFLGGQVWGVLNVEAVDQEALPASDIPLLELFSQQVAIALENARLYQVEGQRRELADTLRQLASAVSSIMNFEQAATTILEYLARVVALDSASVLVMEEDAFRIAAFLTREGVAWTATRMFPRGELLSSELVFDSGEPLMISDTLKSDIWRHDVGRSGIGSWLGFPICFQNKTFGVLGVDRNQPGPFSDIEIQIVKAFADQAATGLANARLFQAVTQRAQENERLREFNENLIRSVETGILLETAEDTILYVNPRLCEMVGYSASELIGQPAEVMLSPQMSAVVDRNAARRRLGEKGRYEASLLHKDGYEVPVLVSATPLFEDGVFAGTLTAFSDITQRKRIERTLLALNAAAAVVRQATEPSQVYRTIAQEVRMLGFSLVAFSYDSVEQSLVLEHRMFDGQLDAIWSPMESMSEPTRIAVALRDVPDFIRPLQTGRAEFVDAPGETASLAAVEQVGVPRQTLNLALKKQRAVLAPLLSQQQTVGIFLVLGETLSEDDLPAFEAFANQASAALDNARLLAAERRERLRAETLGKVASILSSPVELDVALRQVLQQLRSILDYDNGALFLLQDGVMDCQVAEGNQAEWWMGTHLPVESYPLLQEMNTTMQTILISDTRSEPRWVGSAEVDYLASWIGAPLVADGQLVGMLSVDKAQYGYYTRENQEVTTVFADQVSVAIQRARHFNDAQQRLRELQSLVQVSASLTEAPDLVAVLDVVLGSACELLGSKQGALALLAEPGAQLNVVAARGQSPGFVERMNQAALRLPADLARGPSLRAAVLADPEAESPQPGDLVTCVALTLAGQSIGLIEVAQASLDAAQQRLLTAVADLAAAAIDKAQLYQNTVRAYHDLQELDRLKDEFVQNVSHELRTPLTFVKGYVEYLLEGYAGDLNPGQRQALQIVLDRSDAIVRLVNDIVSLKQAELQEMDMQPVALELIAGACVEGSKMAAEQVGVRMHLEISPGLPLVYGDPKRLGQVFDNLLGNAIKFSPDGGEVSVRLSLVGNTVQVEVRDRGIGMPADRLDQIWQRFYQIDSASTRRFAGAGLGLAIVKRIIAAHDGHIWVESALGEGSTFFFTLPVIHKSERV
ncbi:MAG: GAF domain-containing protein [Anaerolineae bacterium]